MRLALLILAALCAPLPAKAQTVALPPECRLLPDHRPDGDVMHRPGQDVVNGTPVVPADINPAAVGTDGTIVAPVSIDLAEKIPALKADGGEIYANLGYLEISPGGRVTFNGQDLTSQVYALCGNVRPVKTEREILSGKPVPPPVSANGQPQGDRIE